MGKQNNTVKFAVPGFFGCSGVPLFRDVPGCSGVPVFRCSGVPGFSTCPLQHFFLACSSARIFFSLSFVLHAIFFFQQVLAGNFFSKSPIFFQNHPPPPPPSRVKWSAPNVERSTLVLRNTDHDIDNLRTTRNMSLDCLCSNVHTITNSRTPSSYNFAKRQVLRES